jgi:hypothetical protein
VSVLTSKEDINRHVDIVSFGPQAVISQQVTYLAVASDDGEVGDRGDRLTHC